MRGISLRDGVLPCRAGSVWTGAYGVCSAPISALIRIRIDVHTFSVLRVYSICPLSSNPAESLSWVLLESRLDRVPSHRGSPKLNANLVPCACVAFFWKPQSRASAFFLSRFIPLLPKWDGPALVDLLSVRCSSRVVGRWNIPRRHCSQ